MDQYLLLTLLLVSYNFLSWSFMLLITKQNNCTSYSLRQNIPSCNTQDHKSLSKEIEKQSTIFSEWRVTQREMARPPCLLSSVSPSFSFNHDAYACDILWEKKNPGFNNLASYLYLWTSNYVMITIVCL